MHPTRDQIVVATVAWLDTMRREFIRRFPDRERLVLPWEQQSPADKASLLRATRAALMSGTPENLARVRERELSEETERPEQ